ncbi:MAG TPA: hypothetical protein VJ372_21495 [Pyrinomonadaceae bacterium]|nr:hypothetical protein [Pyrinomonadaceae bacterium]
MVNKSNGSLSYRVYKKLLFAYPSHFRHSFGPQLLQVFRDCHRAETDGHRIVGVTRLWRHTLIDLISSAAKEHSDTENPFMSNLSKNLIAVFGCVLVIAIAFILLTYGRRNEVSSILVFGYFLDALVTTGLVGNLIVFLLAKTTKFNSVRVAFAIFLVVHALPLILLLLFAGSKDPRFNGPATVIGYVGSFVFWTGLHWMWSRTMQTESQRETNA